MCVLVFSGFRPSSLVFVKGGAAAALWTGALMPPPDLFSKIKIEQPARDTRPTRNKENKKSCSSLWPSFGGNIGVGVSHTKVLINTESTDSPQTFVHILTNKLAPAVLYPALLQSVCHHTINFQNWKKSPSQTIFFSFVSNLAPICFRSSNLSRAFTKLFTFATVSHRSARNANLNKHFAKNTLILFCQSRRNTQQVWGLAWISFWMCRDTTSV